MTHRVVLGTVAAVAVAAGIVFGAGPAVLASPGEQVQLADAAKMAAVKERQETLEKTWKERDEKMEQAWVIYSKMTKY